MLGGGFNRGEFKYGLFQPGEVDFINEYTKSYNKSLQYEERKPRRIISTDKPLTNSSNKEKNVENTAQ